LMFGVYGENQLYQVNVNAGSITQPGVVLLNDVLTAEHLIEGWHWLSGNQGLERFSPEQMNSETMLKLDEGIDDFIFIKDELWLLSNGKILIHQLTADGQLMPLDVGDLNAAIATDYAHRLIAAHDRIWLASDAGAIVIDRDEEEQDS